MDLQAFWVSSYPSSSHFYLYQAVFWWRQWPLEINENAKAFYYIQNYLNEPTKLLVLDDKNDRCDRVPVAAAAAAAVVPLGGRLELLAWRADATFEI